MRCAFVWEKFPSILKEAAELLNCAVEELDVYAWVQSFRSSHNQRSNKGNSDDRDTGNRRQA